MTKFLPEEKHDIAKQKVEELLSHYEEGKEIFKKPPNIEGGWEYPITIKEESKDVPGLPTNWLELVEKVQAIIAVDKYDLDYYPNSVEVITDGQMLDNYSSIGMPISPYEHWSFGMQRIQEEQAYQSGKMGLAYEIVINTDPAIAYCMEKNTPLMQMLVIAHASFGHNSFFKGNHLFKNNTKADTILHDMKNMRDFVRDCEEKYGYREVEKLLDACHALESHGVNRYKKPRPKDPSVLAARRKRDLEDRFSKPHANDLYDKLKPANDFNDAGKKYDPNVIPIAKEENLLTFFADNAPHLPGWKREIMHMMANKAQYFYPQMQTQVMNEGWASFWHHTILHDMDDMGLLNDAHMLEFKASHSNVLFQPEFDSPYFSGRMNPYALGFAMFQDIKRICMEPTDEDKKYFPNIAGNGDWLTTFKDAMENFKDESFIEQYLSPNVMREFNLFAYKDDENEETLEITGIHESRGFQKVREVLASNYRLADIQPVLEVTEYHHKTDRRLVLTHTSYNDKPLEEKDFNEVLRHMYQLWEHPIVVESIDLEDNLLDVFSCPQTMDLAPQQLGLKL